MKTAVRTYTQDGKVGVLIRCVGNSTVAVTTWLGNGAPPAAELRM